MDDCNNDNRCLLQCFNAIVIYTQSYVDTRCVCEQRLQLVQHVNFFLTNSDSWLWKL